MNRADRIDSLAELFEATGEAHHVAFQETDGADPNWAIWYALHLEPRLEAVLGVHKHAQELVVALVEADEEQRTIASDEPWPARYARLFAEHFLPEPAEALALYYYPSCPFCQRVLRVVDRLGVEMELRDIWEDPRHRADLMAARGRATVPVLRCTSSSEDRRPPESRDIIAHLEQRFG